MPIRQFVHPDMPIRASDVNAGIWAHNFVQGITVSAPLGMTRTRNGVAICLQAIIPSLESATVSSGGISAASGSTAGSGNVTFTRVNPVTGAITSNPVTVKVWNLYASAIPAGTTVFVAKIHATWLIQQSAC